MFYGGLAGIMLSNQTMVRFIALPSLLSVHTIGHTHAHKHRKNRWNRSQLTAAHLVEKRFCILLQTRCGHCNRYSSRNKGLICPIVVMTDIQVDVGHLLCIFLLLPDSHQWSAITWGKAHPHTQTVVRLQYINELCGPDCQVEGQRSS